MSVAQEVDERRDASTSTDRGLAKADAANLRQGGSSVLLRAIREIFVRVQQRNQRLDSALLGDVLLRVGIVQREPLKGTCGLLTRRCVR